MHTEHKTIHRLVKPLLKSLCSFILNEFIRIFPRFQTYHSGCHSCLPKYRNRTERSPDACSVTVIKQKYFLGVTLHKACMAGGQRCSQRCHRIGKARLVHGDHIHISLTEDEIILPRRPCHIQAVQVTALVKNLRLRRIQVFRLAISHDTATKSDHTVIHIHDRKDHTVPELVVHSPPLVHIKQSGLTEKIITVSLALQIFIQIITVLIRIAETEFADRLLGKPPA